MKAKLETPEKLWETTEEALKGLRAQRKPTTRGIILCTNFLGKMLQIGIPSESLDTWEILFWITNDGDGNLLPKPQKSAGTLR